MTSEDKADLLTRLRAPLPQRTINEVKMDEYRLTLTRAEREFLIQLIYEHHAKAS